MTEALLQAKSQVSTPVDSDLRSLPNGALVIASRIDSLMARGLGWHTTVGAFSGGIIGGGNATTMSVADEPELSIDVPRLFTTQLVRLSVQAPPSAVSAASDEEMEILCTIDRTQISGSVAADGTVEVPINMRTDIVGGCPNNVVSAVVNQAATTSARSFDLVRRTQVMDYNGSPTEVLWTENDLLYEPETPLLLVGPANISVFFGGTKAVTGFIQAVWVTFPTNEIDDLV